MVASQCSARRRGKPLALQELARVILESPSHVGVARALKRVEELARTDPGFKDIRIDHTREFWEAVELADFEDPESGLQEISRRRSWMS